MIFLIIGEAGHGKDTVAEIIKNKLGEKAAVTSYAGYLKWLYTQFFNWDGIKTVKARTDLQTIGTDIIRETYNEDFWVDRVIEQIQIFNGEFQHFIIPDARFLNEVEKVKKVFGEQGIVTIRVVRPNYESKLTPEQKTHRSEIELDDFQADYNIENISFNKLGDDVIQILQGLQVI